MWASGSISLSHSSPVCLLLDCAPVDQGLGKHIWGHVCFSSHGVPTTRWHAPMKCCLCSTVYPTLTLIFPTLTLAVTQAHEGIAYMHVSARKHKLNPSKMLYLLPISSASQGQRKRSCCCLSWPGASCPDRGPSRDIPERSCWKRGGKSWVFWTAFNDVQSYLVWVWYASTSWAEFGRMCSCEPFCFLSLS